MNSLTHKLKLTKNTIRASRLNLATLISTAELPILVGKNTALAKAEKNTDIEPKLCVVLVFDLFKDIFSK